VKISLGTCTRCLGEITLAVILFSLFAFMDFLLALMWITLIDAEINSFLNSIFIKSFYSFATLGILCLHIFAILELVDIFDLKDEIARVITKLIHRENKKPCNLCISLPVCKELRSCNDLEQFKFKRDRCFFKIQKMLDKFSI